MRERLWGGTAEREAKQKQSVGDFDAATDRQQWCSDMGVQR